MARKQQRPVNTQHHVGVTLPVLRYKGAQRFFGLKASNGFEGFVQWRSDMNSKLIKRQCCVAEMR